MRFTSWDEGHQQKVSEAMEKVVSTSLKISFHYQEYDLSLKTGFRSSQVR